MRGTDRWVEKFNVSEAPRRWLDLEGRQEAPRRSVPAQVVAVNAGDAPVRATIGVDSDAAAARRLFSANVSRPVVGGAFDDVVDPGGYGAFEMSENPSAKTTTLGTLAVEINFRGARGRRAGTTQVIDGLTTRLYELGCDGAPADPSNLVADGGFEWVQNPMVPAYGAWASIFPAGPGFEVLPAGFVLSFREDAAANVVENGPGLSELPSFKVPRLRPDAQGGRLVLQLRHARAALGVASGRRGSRPGREPRLRGAFAMRFLLRAEWSGRVS